MASNTDHVAKLREAVQAAQANGWTTAGSFLSVRMSVHPTPDNIPEHWWPEATYTCVEVLDFTFLSRDRVPICVRKVQHNPWTQGTETQISYRRACELLAQPLDQSPTHSH